MIVNKLKPGDYIFQAKGSLARIVRVNKNDYSYVVISQPKDWWGAGIQKIPFNGIKNHYYQDNEEWFECDDPTAKALEAAFKEYELAETAEDFLKRNKELVGQAKYFLNQVREIPEVEPEEAEEPDWRNF